jgi:hypothetical protein
MPERVCQLHLDSEERHRKIENGYKEVTVADFECEKSSDVEV